MFRSTPLRSALRTVTKSTKPSNNFTSTLRSIQTSSTSTPYQTQSNKSIALETLGIFALFGITTFAFSSIAKSFRLDTKPVEEVEPESAFLYATGGRVKDPKAPVFSRDEVTVVMIIGSPKAGKTTNVMRIAKRFDCQVELADSDIYSDIALNLPTAHLSNPHGSSKLRIVVDDFAVGAPDPLAQALQFEESVAPILLFMFVDCPLKDAELRVDEKDRSTLANEYDAWHRRMAPLIKHYRHKGNFLEVSFKSRSRENFFRLLTKFCSSF